MTSDTENRGRYRRYEDRRVALLLRVHEILFDHLESSERDELLLGAILDNYGADRGAFLSPVHSDDGLLRFDALVGKWPADTLGKNVAGDGLEALLALQENAPGAVTLARVKRPESFRRDAWETLWQEDLVAKALLSVLIASSHAPKQYLWLVQSSYSREWSSRDRELAEEVSGLLARARDKVWLK